MVLGDVMLMYQAPCTKGAQGTHVTAHGFSFTSVTKDQSPNVVLPTSTSNLCTTEPIRGRLAGVWMTVVCNT
jgi:hypothetical protein